MTPYKFKCLQCGKKFKTSRKLSQHQKYYHAKKEKVESDIEQKKKEIKHLEKKVPRKKTNWAALIVLIILILLFIYFVYLRG